MRIRRSTPPAQARVHLRSVRWSSLARPNVSQLFGLSHFLNRGHINPTSIGTYASYWCPRAGFAVIPECACIRVAGCLAAYSGWLHDPRLQPVTLILWTNLPICRLARRDGDRAGVDSSIRELVSGDLDRISIEAIAVAAQKNDSLAFRVLDDAVSHIGVALADVVNLLNPGDVIFGGPLFHAAPHLLEPLKRVIKQRAIERSANQVRLCVSSLGTEAGALGAARVISERVMEDVFKANL